MGKHLCYVAMCDDIAIFDSSRTYILAIFREKEDAESYLTNTGWKHIDYGASQVFYKWYKIHDKYDWKTEQHAWIETHEIL